MGKSIYIPDDVKGIDYQKDLGNAGEYPFTRGIYPEMYRHTPWVIQEETGFDSVEDTRKRGDFLSSIGVRHYNLPSFEVYLDLVTQLGHDSDNPGIYYNIGKEGTHINSIKDMEQLLHGIDLSKTHIAMVAFGVSPMLLAMFAGVAENQGIPLNKLFLSMNNMPLLGCMGENFLFITPRGHMRLMLDVMEFCIEEIPAAQPLSISTYDVREAGATPVQEVAIGLAVGAEFLGEAQKRGLDLAKVASRMHFHVQAGTRLLEDVGKLRALRRMWAKLTRERFGIKDPRACRAKFQVHTQGSSLQTKEPLNNIVRSTIHTLAAVLAGVQTIHTCAYDEAYAIPTEDSAKIAVRTQQIIAEETGVPDVVDPLGGSYYVESLTNEMEEKAWDYLQKIDERGGYISCFEDGFLLNEVTGSALEDQADIDSGKKVIVGVNKYVSDEPDPAMNFFRHSDATSKKAIENINRLREERDNDRVTQALSLVRDALVNEKNTIRPMMEAVNAHATLGEIADICRDMYGEYTPTN